MQQGKMRSGRSARSCRGLWGRPEWRTVEVIRGVVAETKPDILLVIDALAARNSKRLNRTIQIADTGTIRDPGGKSPKCNYGKDSRDPGDCQSVCRL